MTEKESETAIGTDGLSVGMQCWFSTSISNTDGTVGIETGFIKGIITGVNVGSVDIKIVSKHNITTDVWSAADYEEGSSTASFKGYDVGIYNDNIASDTSVNHPNRLQFFNTSGTAKNVERTRFNASVGIGSTEITFGVTSILKSASRTQLSQRTEHMRVRL